jgi:hypothetical protein
VDRRRAYRVFIDGKGVGNIKPGDTEAFEVPPGQHELHLKVDWASSEKLRMEVGDNGQAKFVCKPRITDGSILDESREPARGELPMTGSADFTPEEWEVVREGPTSAGMIVSTAQRGGSFREAFAMAKAYTEARKDHGDSALLDELVSSKPEVDRTKAHSAEGLKEHGLQRIREAVALLEQKATPQEVDDYRRFVISLAKRVAGAKTEGDDKPISEAETAAIAAVTEALGA